MSGIGQHSSLTTALPLGSGAPSIYDKGYKACGHFHVFDPHALWWLFEWRYWDNRIQEIGRRLYCARCLTKDKKVKLVMHIVVIARDRSIPVRNVVQLVRLQPSRRLRSHLRAVSIEGA